MSATLPPSRPLPAVESFVEVLPVPPQQERRRGVVRFVGLTDFADGEWVGIELVGSEGRNDGSVKGQSYFKCLPGQGVFVRPNLVTPYVGLKAEDEKDKAPNPSVAKIADLEAQLAAAKQQATESAAAHFSLKDKLQKVMEELVRVNAAAEAQKAAEEVNLAAQVRVEEERLKLQKQLEVCQAQVEAAQESARNASNTQAAAEARTKEALAAQQRSEESRAQLQTRVEALEVEVAKAHDDLATAAAEIEAVKAQLDAKRTPSLPPPLLLQHQEQQYPQGQSIDPAMKTEVEALRNELQRMVAEREQLRTMCEDLTKAQADFTRERDEHTTRSATAEERACAAEKRMAAVQSEHCEGNGEASFAHAANLADFRAELEALKMEKAQLEHSKAAALRALEERCAHEKEAALRQRDSENEKAMEAANHERSELQELCQLLEDELKEEKNQSDELARLVEQLGAAKASAEAAVGFVQQQTVQERDRLRREVEEARAREVRLIAAVEDAQRERDAALQQLMAQSRERTDVEVKWKNSKSTTDATAASNSAPATETTDASTNAMREIPYSPNAADVDAHAALLAELAKCRNDLDDAQARVFQLTSAQQVAQELQQRCDELSRTIHHQRLEAQKKWEEVQSEAAAAQKKMAAEVMLWKRQCVAAQHNAADLANTVAELQQQLIQERNTCVDTRRSRHRTLSKSPSIGCLFDAAREQRYEEQIAVLTQQLLEHQAVCVRAVMGALSTSMQSPSVVPVDSALWTAPRPPVKVLDFSTPEACGASTQSLFRSAR